MRTVKDVLLAQKLYFLRWSGPDERDHSLNDLNRELIQAMAVENGGNLFLGSFPNGSALTRYENQPLLNFQFNFCVPEADAELCEMLTQWYEDGRSNTELLDTMMQRIDSIGGQHLVWI